MSELEQLIQMLENAKIEYEKDTFTYLPHRIVVRTYAYSFTGKNKISEIFDFTLDGKLIDIS